MYQAANYWVDVVFSPVPPALLTITVTPANSTINVGGNQQFTATGTYQDNSTQNVTSQVAWSSSNTSAVTINSSGLGAAQGLGSTTISADPLARR